MGVLAALPETVPAAARRLRRLADGAIGLVLPRRCLACGTVVEGEGAFCPACWGGIDFLGPPHCARCGFPFEYDHGPGALCGACTARPPAYGRARAVCVYGELSRAPVIAFKHADRNDAAPALARLMATAGAGLLADAGLIVPVPLHRSRLIARRYNQAALLALALARVAGLPALPDALVRTRRTRSQGGLSASGRRRNVAGAFTVRPSRRASVADRHVLLVDDVLTTGATVEACARALLAGGARAVDVLTVARVVRPGQV